MSQVVACIYKFYLHLLGKIFFIKMSLVVSQVDVPDRCISHYSFVAFLKTILSTNTKSASLKLFFQ